MQVVVARWNGRLASFWAVRSAVESTFRALVSEVVASMREIHDALDKTVCAVANKAGCALPAAQREKIKTARSSAADELRQALQRSQQALQRSQHMMAVAFVTDLVRFASGQDASIDAWTRALEATLNKSLEENVALVERAARDWAARTIGALEDVPKGLEFSVASATGAGPENAAEIIVDVD
jgi:predicted transcriptional regulator